MSYILTAYILDIDQLKSVFGSNDQKLLNAIRENQVERLEELDECFEDEIEEGAPTTFAAIEQIVAGVITNSDDAAFQYGYAIEFICQELGERVLTDDLGILSVLKLNTKLSQPRLPLPIPQPEDFPEISFLTAYEVTTEHSRFTEEKSTWPQNKLRKSREEFFEILSRARQSGKDLVTFTA